MLCFLLGQGYSRGQNENLGHEFVPIMATHYFFELGERFAFELRGGVAINFMQEALGRSRSLYGTRVGGGASSVPDQPPTRPSTPRVPQPTPALVPPW